MADVSSSQLVQRDCGIDVHLKVVVAKINGEGLKRETPSFGAFTGSLTEMKEWLLANGFTYVTMESTGVYWKPVYNVLEGNKKTLVKYVNIKGNVCKDKSPFMFTYLNGYVDIVVLC